MLDPSFHSACVLSMHDGISLRTCSVFASCCSHRAVCIDTVVTPTRYMNNLRRDPPKALRLASTAQSSKALVRLRQYIQAAAVLPPYLRRSNRSPRADAQLLRAPPLAALSSSILATRFLNSSYWHFSYECRSSCTHAASATPSTRAAGAFWGGAGAAYLALPRQVVGVVAAAVQGDQQVRAAVPVGHGEPRRRHVLARGGWSAVDGVSMGRGQLAAAGGGRGQLWAWTGRYARVDGPPWPAWPPRPTASLTLSAAPLMLSTTVMALGEGGGVWSSSWLQ